MPPRTHPLPVAPRPLRTLMCAAALLALLAPAARADRPNIVFIFTDDHGAQAISAYGSNRNQTPHLDRLAREGLRFANCFVTNSICAPSRAAILTGRHTHRSWHTTNERQFNRSLPTFPKMLQAAGYQTALIGKWHLNCEPAGFDYWDILINQGIYYNAPSIQNGRFTEHTGYTTDVLTDLALEWLDERRAADQPFLLMLQHKAPHRGWDPGPAHYDLFDGQTLPEPPTLFDDWAHRSTAWSRAEMSIERHLNDGDLHLVAPRWQFTAEQLAAWDADYEPENAAFRAARLSGRELTRWKYQRYAKDYLKCVASVDDSVGRVLAHLDQTGLAASTIVVYSSDNGWFLGEHGLYDKRWMYEESLRIPLLVRWPGVTPAGAVNRDLVLNIDFAPTFLEAAGAPVPGDLDGRSLVPLLRGQTPADWRPALYYHFFEDAGAHRVPRHRGIRTQRHKLIHFHRLNEWELFDLERDPDELVSVYDDPAYAAVRADLTAELDRQMAAVGDGPAVDAEYDEFQRLAELQAAFLKLIGRMPNWRRIVPAAQPVEAPSGLRVEALRFRVGEDEVTARLYAAAQTPATPQPAVVLLHAGPDAHTFALGKSGLEKEGLPAALARRGYVVLCPDRAGFEERRLPEVDPGDAAAVARALAARRADLLLDGSSMLAVELAEILACADYLMRRSDVHVLRVAVVGLGEGAELVPWALFINESLAAGAAAGPTADLHALVSRTPPGTCGRYTLPGLRAWGDVPDVLAGLFPRPFLLISETPPEPRLLRTASAWYELHGLGGRIEPRHPDADLAGQIADWLDRHLK